MTRVLGGAAWCGSVLAVVCLVLGVVAAPVGVVAADEPPDEPIFFCNSLCAVNCGPALGGGCKGTCTGTGCHFGCTCTLVAGCNECG
jgi:hypothetical protein